MSSEPIRGFVAAPFTPMHPDGRVDFDRIPAYAAHLRASGVRGVFVNGTTGEGYALSCDERMQAAESWVRESGDELLVIVHVGAESLVDASRLAAHAQQIRADGIASMSPVFFRPGLAGLVDWCRKVAAAAPELPFYYYHIPSMTGMDVPIVDFLDQAGGRVPTLRGVKYTHHDLMDFRLCASLDNRRYDLLFGRDEILLSALVLGTEGMVGSTYNYAMPLYHAIMSAFREGRLDEAARVQERVMQMVSILVANGGGVAAGKALMRGTGLDMGPSRVGSPVADDVADAAVAAARSLGAYGPA